MLRHERPGSTTKHREHKAMRLTSVHSSFRSPLDIHSLAFNLVKPLNPVFSPADRTAQWKHGRVWALHRGIFSFLTVPALYWQSTAAINGAWRFFANAGPSVRAASVALLQSPVVWRRSRSTGYHQRRAE